ncbi:MAG: polymerase III subunit gamma and tau protein [Microgenomates group bacterium GW2011_GWF2_47_9]|nr:MAG: polymerase III subunit gamma and tau protein [Microgenomates group bacterium GW2011_GWF2_47_9]
MNLYLKYRPQTIQDLDLETVRESLLLMISRNAFSHAYLLTGPRGSGKTSSARILARVVNCENNVDQLGEPCNKCPACLSILGSQAVDVVEIDAASNRGIDDIRDLKERIRLAPALLRKKVYIIDEVHMLTTEAFNALLKTLEEPPPHAMFILCTTEAHKVPATISSRCVEINFTRATASEMVRSLERVVRGEKMELEDGVLEKIAESVDGSFRDGVKILDSVWGGMKVTLAEVERAMFGKSGFDSKILSIALIARDREAALAAYAKACQEGVEFSYLLVSVMRDLRNQVMASDDGSHQELIPLIYKLDEVARKIGLSAIPEILIEMTIVEWCGNDSSPKPGSSLSGKSQEKKKEPEQKKVKEMEVGAGEMWSKMLANLNGDSYSLGALLSKAHAGTIRGDELTIEVGYDFHRAQLMQDKFRARVEEFVSRAVGRKMQVKCVVSEKHAKGELQSRDSSATIPRDSSSDDQDLAEEAIEIFSN